MTKAATFLTGLAWLVVTAFCIGTVIILLQLLLYVSFYKAV